MWAGVTGEPSWGKGDDASAVLGVWGLGKRDPEAEEVWVWEGGPGPWWRGWLKGSPAYLSPRADPPSRAGATLGCYGWQGVGLRSVLLYLG